MDNKLSSHFVRIIYNNKTEDIDLTCRGGNGIYYCEKSLHDILHIIDSINYVNVCKRYYDHKDNIKISCLTIKKIILYYDNDPKNGLIYNSINVVDNDSNGGSNNWFYLRKGKIDNDTLCLNPKDDFLRYANNKLKKHCIEIVLL